MGAQHSLYTFSIVNLKSQNEKVTFLFFFKSDTKKDPDQKHEMEKQATRSNLILMLNCSACQGTTLEAHNSLITDLFIHLFNAGITRRTSCTGNEYQKVLFSAWSKEKRTFVRCRAREGFDRLMYEIGFIKKYL